MLVFFTLLVVMSINLDILVLLSTSLFPEFFLIPGILSVHVDCLRCVFSRVVKDSVSEIRLVLGGRK